MNQAEKGSYNEAAVMTALLWLGDYVSTPWGDHRPYDLIIDRGGRLLRGQIKSGQVTESGSVTVSLGGGGKRVQPKYHGNVDLLWVRANGTIYEVPMSDVPVGCQRFTIAKDELNDYLIA